MAKRRRIEASKACSSRGAFADLTWDDLEEWAGDRVVERGRRYQQHGAVHDLARRGSDTLIAWVVGTSRYATKVQIEKRRLSSDCTCPYGTECKHAVALLLEHLTRTKRGEHVPAAAADDARIDALERGSAECDDLDYCDDSGVDIVPSSRAGQHGKASNRRLTSYLQKKSKEDLLQILGGLMNAHPEVLQEIRGLHTLEKGGTEEMAAVVRAEIAGLGEPEYDEPYGWRAPSNDLDRLSRYLKAMLDVGQADTALQLGPDLLRASHRVLECEEESESYQELSSCLAFTFEALGRSSLSAAKQLLWAVDMDLADDHELCAEGLSVVLDREFSEAAWSTLADQLLVRVGKLSSTKEADYHRAYARDRLTDWIITALEQTDRTDVIIPLCEREAAVTGSYVRLVDRLMDEERWADADVWCRQGIEHTAEKWPGIANSLRERLRTIATKQGDPMRAVALVAEAFFDQPSLDSFVELLDAAEAVRKRSAVEEWARYFLVTGYRPGSRRKGKRRKDEPHESWPLPDVKLASSRKWEKDAPMTDILMDVALHQESPDELVKWYELHKKQGRFHRSYDGTVARAVEKTHPQLSIDLYKKIAEQHIETVTTKGYEAAGRVLRRLKTVLVDNERTKEWEQYLTSLRENNRRRPRCIAVLDRIGVSNRIIDSV